MKRIVLADDHLIVRQGLRALLEANSDFSVDGETGDGLEAVELVEKLTPDVLVVDLAMPSLNGLEVTRRVVKSSPQTSVIILSMHANEAYVLEALKSGAAGYVLKDSSSTELVQAIHEVTAGRRFLSAPLSDRAIEAYMHRVNQDAKDRYETLTNREREVLHLSVEGKSSKEIAARLSISTRTAEAHRANLMRKLDIRTQTDLVLFALQRGIIIMEDSVEG